VHDVIKDIADNFVASTIKWNVEMDLEATMTDRSG
jgi:hypothetical protein